MRRFLFILAALATVLGIAGPATAASPPPPTGCTTCHGTNSAPVGIVRDTPAIPTGIPTVTPDAVGNYYLNASNVGVGVSDGPLSDPQAGPYVVLPPGQDTSSYVHWTTATAVFDGGGYCLNTATNNGELGWHFYHFFYAAPGHPTYFVLGSASNVRIIATKTTAAGCG